jgi:hypothetical protein
MSTSFEDTPPDDASPPIQQPEIRDENIGTLFKIGGAGCIALCACMTGFILLIPVLMFAPYGISTISAMFVIIGLTCMIVGWYAVYYGWKAAETGSKW